MTNLPDLPNEIIALIWNHVVHLPRDVTSFALADKRIHKVGEAALTRHRLHKEWHLLVFSGDEHACGEDLYAIDWFSHLLREPEKAFYVNTIHLHPSIGFESKPNYQGDWRELLRVIDSQRLQPTSSTLIHPWSEYRAMLELSRRLRGSTYPDENGLESTACFLIAVMCPRLSTLWLSISHNEDLMESYFQHILAMQSAGWNFLRKLTTIYITDGYDGPGRDYRIAAAASKWPYLDTSCCQYLSDDFGYQPLATTPIIQSNVREMVFEMCGIELGNMKTLLAGSVKLRSFTYSHGYNLYPPVSFCASDMCSALAEVVGDTLVSLRLDVHPRFEGEVMKPIEHPKGFRRLELLAIQLRWLLYDGQDPLSNMEPTSSISPHRDPGPNMQSRKLHDLLPATIKIVHFDCENQMDGLLQILDGLPSFRSATLPYLASVGLAYRTKIQRMSRLGRVIAIIREAGIDYEHLGDALPSPPGPRPSWW